MYVLKQIANLCQELECNFTINNWSYPEEQIPHYEWRIESDRRGESNGVAAYDNVDDCLQGCVSWLSKVKQKREN